jgi:hypothetical protein
MLQTTEVALDWNAGFTGMLAGLVSEPTSWDDCYNAGLQSGRAEISPALNAASVRRPGGAVTLLAIAAAATAVGATLLL